MEGKIKKRKKVRSSHWNTHLGRTFARASLQVGGGGIERIWMVERSTYLQIHLYTHWFCTSLSTWASTLIRKLLSIIELIHRKCIQGNGKEGGREWSGRINNRSGRRGESVDPPARAIGFDSPHTKVELSQSERRQLKPNRIPCKQVLSRSPTNQLDHVRE